MLEHATARPRAAALREKEYGIWQTTTWGTLAVLVRRLACGLAQAGLAAGEHLVVIGANRPRLQASMLAAQSLGAVPVPLYQDAAAAEFVFPIVNAEVRGTDIVYKDFYDIGIAVGGGRGLVVAEGGRLQEFLEFLEMKERFGTPPQK